MTGSVRLIAVGDLQLGDSATCVGFGFRSRVSKSALAGALAEFRSTVGASDITFGNLETPLSDLALNRTRRRSRQLRGAPDLAEALRSAGFTLLNVANNHSLEHGASAFADSVQRLEAHGIGVCGRRGVDGWASEPSVISANRVRVGTLGYTLRKTDAGAPAPHAEPSEDQILADVVRLRPTVDALVVSLHWGEEFVRAPSRAEVALAHRVVDAGATLILGHHPHVARPVERYRNSVIAYSLGNFAADMVWHAPLRDGLVLDCEIQVGGVEQVRVYKTRIDDRFVPRLDNERQLPVTSANDVPSLADDEYIRQARATVAAQRRDLYRYTARNAWRFDPAVLLELATTTVRGKVSGLFGTRDEIWG